GTVRVPCGTMGEVGQVERLRVGAGHVNASAGVNGPAGSPGAMGLVLTDVEFGLALLKARAPPAAAVATDLRTWTALKATIGGAEIVGIDGLTIAVHNLSI